MGGFECSTHRRRDGRRLDLIAATGHDEFCRRGLPRHDRARPAHGSRRAALAPHRDRARPVRLVELPAHAACQPSRPGCRSIWDLCHYGWPDDLDIWQPDFVDRFASFAAAVATLVRDETPEVPFYCPINEISYWAWAGGDMARFNPMARGRGTELKRQLVRASIAAIEAIRDVDPRARFVQIDPVINVVPKSPR